MIKKLKKTRYLLLLLAFLFIGLTYTSFHLWWQEYEQEFNQKVSQAVENGQKFAQKNTQLACFNKVIQDSAQCREASCSVEWRNFLAACFEQAKPSTKFCAETPTADDYFGRVSWAVSACRKRKNKTGNCPNLIDETPRLCRQYSEQASDKNNAEQQANVSRDKE